jgi:hypothetical protein
VSVNPLTLESILIKAPTEAAAFAGGLAIGPALAPLLRDLENLTWSLHPDKRLDLVLAAEVAAEDVAVYDAMAAEAKQGGYDGDRFKWAYGATLQAPGVGELLTLLRRNSEVPIDFAHGLRKARLEAQWDDALRNLRDVRIPGPDLAYMVVRGVVPDGGTLASSLPTRADNLSLPPQLNIDTLAEAAKTGWDAERFAALVARSGLAMGPVQAAQAHFRGILSLNDYELTIARGDLFPAFADPVLEVSRQIPSATDYVQGRLRGWIDTAAMDAGAARHGMTAADTDLLFKIHGRPLSFHQVFIGLRRGGVYDGPTTSIDTAFLTALRQSDIRPEWYNLAWAQRYNYPTAFVLRALTEAGDLTQQETEQILLYEGWEPTLAAKVSTKWAGGVTASGDPHEAKAQTQLWTTTHRSYVASEIDAATATSAIEAAGVAPAAVPGVLALWDAERALIRKQLSPKEIQKALRDQLTNPATGQPWTPQDAISALQARGYDLADATVIVDEA